MRGKVVRRVADAPDEVERIEAPEGRVPVRAKSAVMSARVRRDEVWSAGRREPILKLYDEGARVLRPADRTVSAASSAGAGRLPRLLPAGNGAAEEGVGR